MPAAARAARRGPSTADTRSTMAVSRPGVTVNRPAATVKASRACSTVMPAPSRTFHQGAVLDHTVEARTEADVADAAVAAGDDLGQHGVLVAVDAQFAHGLELAAGLALLPQLLALAAEEMDEAGVEGGLEG